MRLFLRHRRRLASLSVGVFLAVVAVEIGGAYPREVQVSLPLGEDHARFTDAYLEYSAGGETVRNVHRHFRSGAPPEVRDSVDLSPGDYEVSVLLVDRDGSTRSARARLHAPTDGVVRLPLEVP